MNLNTRLFVVDPVDDAVPCDTEGSETAELTLEVMACKGSLHQLIDSGPDSGFDGRMKPSDDRLRLRQYTVPGRASCVSEDLVVADPLAGPGLLTGTTKRCHGLFIAQDVNSLQESFELLCAEQYGRRGTVLRDRNDVIVRLQIPDQIQTPIWGLRDGDEMVYVSFITLSLPSGHYYSQDADVPESCKAGAKGMHESDDHISLLLNRCCWKYANELS